MFNDVLPLFTTRFILLLFTMLALIVLSCAQVPAQVSSGDGVITASSSQGDQPPMDAFDGSIETRWCAESITVPQWLKADLGKSLRVTGVEITWEHSSDTHKCRIEGSNDGALWTILSGPAVEEGASVGNIHLTPSDVRYFRITVLSVSNGAWASIREVAIHTQQNGKDVVWEPAANSSAILLPAIPIKITLDGAAKGRPFEGLGAVSGGGNSSRLLADYPQKQKQQILDYLFKPQFGASLSELKVEVGGDVNSTQGSEPSHMHIKGDENYNRGFEWWLMEQAKARNPGIALDCVAWGAPGWIGNGNYWSADMIDYYIKFIKGAKQHHGLDIDSVGGKNESGYNADWFIAFRNALNDKGLSKVRLVASDDWGPAWLNVAKESLTKPELAKALDVYAGHLTWSENPGAAPKEILDTGKPIWNTEMHNYIPGTGEGLSGFDAEISLVKAFNINYIKTKITRTIFWYLIWSTYPESSYPDIGMIRANTPWNGNYEVLPEMWGYAHVNQFVQPGWTFLENGGNGELPGGGTYTALLSPKGDYSVILETKGAKAPQQLQLNLKGGLSSKALHVWTSTKSAQFVQAGDIAPVSGQYTLTLNPNTVYSITTTTGQRKGAYPSPPANTPFTLPYADDYQNYALNFQAKYHFDYNGAFEIANKTKGTGKCLRQAATKSASGWGAAYYPLTVLGSGNWKDYTASVDAYIEDAGAVSIHGRVGSGVGGSNDANGYTFRVQDNGDWELKSFNIVIAKGSTPFSANNWHNLKLKFKGSNITAFVDQKQVTTVDDKRSSAGLVGLGTGWNFAQFCNLTIR